MKCLIAIKSCARDAANGVNQAVRNTWLRHLQSANYCFVLGRGAIHNHPDELILDCGDDYLSLPEKTKALVLWSLEHEFDFVFSCDVDTFVLPARLLGSDFDFDYAGRFNGDLGVPNAVYQKVFSWASGGSGYWLSRKAQELVAKADLSLSTCPELKIPCEDLWVGQVLGPYIRSGEIKAKHDPGYGRSFRDDYKTEITSHYCSQGEGRVFDPAWLYKHYEANFG